MASMLVFVAFLLNLVHSVDSTACGVSFNESSGSVSSPDFPSYFPASLTGCSWSITVPSGRIKLTFHAFTLETNSETFCTSQSTGARLSITNVASDDNRNPFQLCGQQIPPPVYSLGKFMTITLDTSRNRRPGFNLTYESITDEILCPSAANLTDSSGEITSPFFPRNYPSKQDCHWEITAPKGKPLMLEVTDMNIESCGQDGSCTCDYLQIMDGFNDADGAASGIRCGVKESSQPLIYYSTNERMRVRFFSNLPVGRSFQGFKATYSQLDYSPPECPDLPIHLSGNGSLRSPNYPRGKYRSGRNCYWLITAAPDKRVKVNIKDFAMGQCDNCNADYCSRVEFYDGPSANASYLGRFCTGSTLTAKVSSGNQMYVHFYSSFSPDRGFSAEYSETTEDLSPTQTRPPTTTTTQPPTTAEYSETTEDLSPTQTRPPPTTTAKPPTTAEYSETTEDLSLTQTRPPPTTTAKPPTTGAAAMTITLLLVILPSFAVTMLWP